MAKSSDPRKTIELIYAVNEIKAKRSLAEYLEVVKIDCRPEPDLFGNVIEDWQRERNSRLVPALEFVGGIRKDYTGPLNFYEGLSKGQDKSSYLARCLNWLLGFAPRKNLRCCVAAKDAAQADVIRDCMFKEAKLNCWIDKNLDFSKKDVRGKHNGSVLNILTNDAAGSHGTSFDLTVCDELSHWDSDKMYQSLFAGSKKKQGHSVFVVLTNAGIIDSWQWDVKETFRRNHGPDWSYFSQPPGKPLASWITAQALTEAKEAMSSQEFRRLFLNEWLSATEDRGAFRPEDVDACVGEPLPVPSGGTAVIGIDYGGVCDRTALVVVWWDGKDKIHVPQMTVWQGSAKNEIKVSAVNEWLERQLKKYKKRVLVFDVHQMLETVQRLEDRGVSVVRFNWQAGKSNVQMLLHLRALLTDRKLVYADDTGDLNGETLVDELKMVITKQQRHGERFDHESGLHDDRICALGMACMEAVKHPPTLPMEFGKPVEQPKTPLRNQVDSIFSQDHISRRGLFGA